MEDGLLVRQLSPFPQFDRFHIPDLFVRNFKPQQRLDGMKAMIPRRTRVEKKQVVQGGVAYHLQNMGMATDKNIGRVGNQ